MNRIRCSKNDLRFLLKDKYKWKEVEILEFLKGNKVASKKIYNDIHLLEKGIPLAYIIGFVEFLGTKIDLRYKSLIPRVETEYWVGKVIKDIDSKTTTTTILDIYCGSGCIGIALLKHLPNIHVTFTDIDDNALKQTKFNLELNKIPKSRYKVIKSTHFNKIKGKFNYIIANPPYIAVGEKVDPDIIYEPHKALYSGNNGLNAIKVFLDQVKKHMKLNSVIFIEFGEHQKNSINNLLKGYKYKNWEFNKDQFNKYRWAKITNN